MRNGDVVDEEEEMDEGELIGARQICSGDRETEQRGSHQMTHMRSVYFGDSCG